MHLLKKLFPVLIIVLSACGAPVKPLIKGENQPGTPTSGAKEPAQEPGRPTPTPVYLPATATPMQSGQAKFLGITFDVPPSLAGGVEGKLIPAHSQLSGSYGLDLPEGVGFTLTNPYSQKAPFDRFSQPMPPWFEAFGEERGSLPPVLYVFPVQELVQVSPVAARRFFDLYTLVHAQDLETLLSRGSSLAALQLPVLPVFNASQDLHTQVKPLSFVNGQGVRFLTHYTQDASPIVNPAVFYTFQGLTNDNQFYVAAFFPVEAEVLGNENQAAAGEASSQKYAAYLQATSDALDSLSPAAFAPDLGQLDALVESLRVDWQREPSIQPVEARTRLEPGERQNLMAAILPPGLRAASPARTWTAQPSGRVGGQAFILQDIASGGAVGAYELQIFPLDSYPELQSLLQKSGFVPVRTGLPGNAERDPLEAALHAFVEGLVDSLEASHASTLPEGVAFGRLPVEEIEFGELPGVAYGFNYVDDLGNAIQGERTYLTTDGRLVFLVSAGWGTSNPWNYAGESAFLDYEPALRQILAELRIPLPVLQTTVAQVRLLQDQPLVSAPFTRPKGITAKSGVVLNVTGASADGRMLRVDCPQGTGSECWLQNDLRFVQDVQDGPAPAPPEASTSQPYLLPYNTPVHGLAFTPDGKALAAGYGDVKGAVMLWDLKVSLSESAFAIIKNLTVPEKDGVTWVDSVTVSSNGVWAAAGLASGDVLVWDLRLEDLYPQPAQVISPQQAGVDPNSNSPLQPAVAFAPQGGRLAVAYLPFSLGGKVLLWDADAKKLVREFHASHVSNLAFSPDGKLLLIGTNDGVVQMWEVESGRRLFSATGPWAGITGLAFTPDGERIVVGYINGEVQVRQAAGGGLISSGQVGSEQVYGLAISSDGRYLAVGSAEGKVFLIDYPTLSNSTPRILDFPEQSTVSVVAFSPDGQLLAAGGSSGMIAVWNLPELNSGQ